jgi:hypothetical protein
MPKRALELQKLCSNPHTPHPTTYHNSEALLGKGNFASVYLVRRVASDAQILESQPGAGAERKVVKVLGEANLWEMHVSAHLRGVLPADARSSFTWFDGVVALKDGTWLTSEYKAQASLQDVINAHRKANKKLDEVLSAPSPEPHGQHDARWCWPRAA